MASRSKRAKAQKKPKGSFIALSIIVVLLFLGGVGAASAMALVDTWLEDVPDISDFETFNVARKTTLLANDGTTILAEFYQEDREPVEANQVSQHVFDATIAVEDERYWQHSGVDLYGIARAVVNELLGGDLQGASTITQQLVRQTVLQEEANDITIKRKVREIYLAIGLEAAYGKETVLMMYLNTINYGDGAYGIESAAKHYFSKNAADLTLAEAALLSGIPQQPTYLNPVSYPDNALSRRNDVLERMRVNGYITDAQCEEAKAQPLGLVVNETPEDGIYSAHYFSAYVRNLLEKQYTTNTVFTSGLTVYTTLDPTLQALAEETCAAREATVASDVEMGLTSIDPRTGYILAMRGGKNFYADQWSSSTDMSRGAGSSFKTFGLIAAIEQGYSPQTSIDASTSINYGGDWPVSNYGNANYGTRTLESATWVSSNTAYVRVVRAVGAKSIVDVAHRCGIQSDLAAVNSIVLGSQGVNTLEMASAYGTIGNNGVYVEPTAITKILDVNGEVIFEHEAVETQALTPEVAYATVNVLKGVITSGTATKAAVDGHVAYGKTGITDDYHDAWFVGGTPQLATAMWLGAPEPRDTGYTAEDYVCPYWGDYMSAALAGQEAIAYQTAKDPEYKSDATFMSTEEKAAADAAAAEAKKLAEEEEAARIEQEEQEKQEEDSDESAGTGSATTTGVKLFFLPLYQILRL